MAYNFNGYEVGLILKVGNDEHSVCTQFSATVDGQYASYQQITADEFVRLEEADRAKRVKAFYAYLSSRYSTNIEELVKLNPEFPDRRQNGNTCKPSEKPYKVYVTIENGHVDGKNSFILEFAKGEECIVKAVSNNANDYGFGAWYMDGVEQKGVGEEILFKVDNDVNLVAKYLPYYTVTVVSNDMAKGTVSGGGRALAGSKVTINAAPMPETYYSFTGWYEQGTGNRVSLEANTEYVLTKNIVLEARFADTRPTVIVEVMTEHDLETGGLKIWAHRTHASPTELHVFCSERGGAIYVEELIIPSGELDSDLTFQRTWVGPWASYFVIDRITPSEDMWYKYEISSNNKY